MRILLGYSYYEYEVDVKATVDAWLGRLRAQGFAVESFCLTLRAPGPRLIWRQLDERWRRGDLTLLRMYEQLAKRLEQFDVLLNWNGINLHPEFIRQLPSFNVFGCFDDPEASADLSEPVAAAYDLCMVGNIAELETYRRWGVKEVRFWPMGFRLEDYNQTLTKDDILTGKRPVDVAMLCERTSPLRRARLDRFTAAFPQGEYYGSGWPKGFLPETERVPLLQRSKIGINIHNSTGPINYRTYYLPANGVMQICDNKSHLGQIFELNKEVVGFDTMDEAVDLCRYYLAHDEERRQIAAAGWERALRDYNEVAVFGLVEKYVRQVQRPASRSTGSPLVYLRNQQKRSAMRRLRFRLRFPFVEARRWVGIAGRKLRAWANFRKGEANV